MDGLVTVDRVFLSSWVLRAGAEPAELAKRPSVKGGKEFISEMVVGDESWGSSREAGPSTATLVGRWPNAVFTPRGASGARSLKGRPHRKLQERGSPSGWTWTIPPSATDSMNSRQVVWLLFLPRGREFE